MSDVEPIRSERLELLPLARAFRLALLRGERRRAQRILGAKLPADFPGTDSSRFHRRHRRLEANPDLERWLTRLIVLTENREVIGDVGFHDAPDAQRRLELGYRVFAPHRGRGYATEAAWALIRWAHEREGITRFLASVAPTNAPSLAVVRKLGFVETGSRIDEVDGLELVFELNL
jgi:[ribosomal protein S5]-alanine N-acetyltransferase